MRVGEGMGDLPAAVMSGHPTEGVPFGPAAVIEHARERSARPAWRAAVVWSPIEGDIRSHGNVAGLEAAATRYVASATDTMFLAYNGYSAGNHTIYDYAGTSKVTNLAWEKSGTPTYPVAGAITLH